MGGSLLRPVPARVRWQLLDPDPCLHTTKYLSPISRYDKEKDRDRDKYRNEHKHTLLAQPQVFCSSFLFLLLGNICPDNMQQNCIRIRCNEISFRHCRNNARKAVWKYSEVKVDVYLGVCCSVPPAMFLFSLSLSLSCT